MLKEYLTTLADKFRSILGTKEPINGRDFPNKIEEVYRYAWNDGMGTGYNYGIEEGKQAEYDRFWNLYQPNGNNPTGYSGAFSGNRWTNETFTPKYDIVPDGAQNMFWNSSITDIVAACERQGIKLDFSQNSTGGWGNTFSYAKSTRLGEISAKGAQLSATFSNASVQTIEKLIVSETTSYGSAFNGCSKLKNITFEGVIGKSGLNLQHSTLLSKTSIQSVINALSTTTSELSITLSLTAVKNAFETSSGVADGNTSTEWLNLIATKSNWTINLV